MRPIERCEIWPTSPRLTAARASSLWLQWVLGHPLADGGSQARATIAQICSAVKVAGAPERGASARRSATPSPPTDRLGLDLDEAGGLAHAPAVPGQQDDPSP
jgi:hypothetical protein